MGCKKIIPSITCNYDSVVYTELLLTTILIDCKETHPELSNRKRIVLHKENIIKDQTSLVTRARLL